MSTPTFDTALRPVLGALAILVLSTAAGCGGDAPADAGRVADESAAARSTGTLVIGETTYDFTVHYCDVASPDGAGSLSGRGKLGDGTPFQVSVSRAQVPTLAQQQVTIFTNSAPDRLNWSALRVNIGHGWSGEGLGGAAAPDAPLVVVDGNTVSVEAAFADDREVPDGERHPPTMGRLTATCP